MYEITAAQRTTSPYSAICYVVCTWSDGSSTRGSGVVVGANDVLTALHVVYNATRGGWATSISVSPGYDTQPRDAPYGTFTNWGRVAGRTGDWDPNGDGLLSDAESQYDLALIGMRSRIGDVTGWLPTESLSADFYGVMAGYPARGSGQMAESVYADASSRYGVYDINNSSLGPGASGGPLLHTDGAQTYVTGVLSSGASDLSSSTYAGLFGPGNMEWLTAAMAANDDLIANQAQVAISGGAGNDTLSGNELANTVSGDAGNDVITGGGGNDSINGGDGLDTAVFSGARSGYTVSIAGGTTIVADRTGGRDGTDTLTQVERLRFADASVALDISGAAGATAKILGAVYGKAGLANLVYVGTGLALFDGGMLYVNVVKLALDARLGADASNTAVVDLLYTNVVGSAPGASERAYYVALLESGQYSAATLGAMAAETPQNQANVNLVGLASTGLDYTPVV